MRREPLVFPGSIHEVIPGVSTQTRRQKIEPERVMTALNETGTVSGAARILGLPRSTFEYWMLKYGVTLRRVAVIRGGKGGKRTPRK